MSLPAHLDENPDVVVVGAGLAGLIAATDLREAGLSALVLEAGPRCGGRVDAEELAPGLMVDLGGTFVNRDQTEMLGLASQAGVSPVPVGDKGDLIVYADSKGRRFTSADEFCSETRDHIRALELMAESVPLEAPWECERAGEFDETTLAAWIHANASPESSLELLSHVEALMGQTSAFSLLHFLFYSRSNGGLGTFFGTGEAHDEFIFAGAAGSIARWLADELGESIVGGADVSSITEDGSQVAIQTSFGNTQARCCVVACSPTLQKRIRFDPPLSEARSQLSSRMPEMSLYRVAALYDSPFWREENLTGRGFTPTLETLDTSPPSAGTGVLNAYMWSHNAAAAGLADQDWTEVMINGISELFGERARTPRHVLTRHWGDAGGCVTSMAPGAWTGFGHALREPCGRVHWAGTETASMWCGQMEGAVRSGHRAADEVLRRHG